MTILIIIKSRPRNCGKLTGSTITRFGKNYYHIRGAIVKGSNRAGSVGLFPTLSSHTTVRAFLAYGGLLE